MPMKAGSVESLVTRKQSAYFARLRLLFEEGFGNTPQDRDSLDQLNPVNKEDSAPASYPLQKPALPTTVKEFSAPLRRPGATKQLQGISSSAEAKDEGKKMTGNPTRKVLPELPLKPSDIRRSVLQSPSESGNVQRPSLGQMGFIRPKRPRTHNLRPQSPKPPVIGTYSPDEDLFKISKSPASGSNSSPGRPFRTQPFALTSQIDKT
ncbi:hypothetical protein PHET_11715 [Paragonimus heterotremus]|uniref:Uncharacterized protein n=1 Tax=Paragonimus heterotremus TaxID=100268 RepID=A0A8J4WSB6_9TREM|nr:hypothetical protein PHET_11715 [Paragonimus heterotremus]